MFRHRWLVVLLCSVIALLGGVSLAVAQTAGGPRADIESLNKEIEARKEKIKQLDETIQSYRKTINQKQTEAVSLRNQLAILDNRIAQLNAELEQTQEKIKQATLEIEALELSIKEKEELIARQRRVIAELVRQINATGQKNTLEVLLTYNSLADFYNELRQTEVVYADLGRAAKAVRLAKEELEAKRRQVAERRAAYAKLKAELDGKKEDIVEQSQYKQQILIATKSSEVKYRTLLDSLKRQYQVIENEVRGFEAEVRRKLAAQDKELPTGDVVMSWPIESRYITAGFHDPDYPFRKVFEHSGVDLRASQGTPVKAAAAGYVARARRCTLASCYSYVLLVHTGNISTLYGHLSNVAVADDAFVNRGDVIGYSGGTPGTVGAGPFVTGPHLHFEVRLNGIPVDPMGYLLQ
ncbi:MAG: peptidoglycan DD-metalloendopeptidase family protein [Candidatus Magasanikbacteria bacterium]|nr:peptidoglycan DD-metalloendopeptidase family protein [Candidatus Magasanikbacteria bacterium]